MEISQNNEFRLIYRDKHEFFRSKSRKEAITIILNKKRFKIQNIQEPEGKIVEKGIFYDLEAEVFSLLQNSKLRNFKNLLVNLTAIRQILLLSVKNERFFVEKLFSTPIFDILTPLLNCEEHSIPNEIITEIFWLISNVLVYCTQEETIYFINQGLLENCLTIIKQGDEELIQDALWTLGNLIEDDSQRIIRIFEGGWIFNLPKNLKLSENRTKIYLDVVFLLNRCSEISIPIVLIKQILKMAIYIFKDFEIMEGKIEVFKVLGNLCFKYSDNCHMRNHIFFELFKNSKNENFRKNMLRMVKSLFLKFKSLSTCFFNILGLLAKCEKGQIQIILTEEKEILETFYLLIVHSDEELFSLASLLVNEFIKKNIDEIEFFFYDEKIISKFVCLLQNKMISIQVKKAILQIFQSFCLRSKNPIIENFNNGQFLEILVELLNIENKKDGFLLMLLETLEIWINLLRFQSNECFLMMLKTLIDEKLQLLGKEYSEKAISQKAVFLEYIFQEISSNIII